MSSRFKILAILALISPTRDACATWTPSRNPTVENLSPFCLNIDELVSPRLHPRSRPLGLSVPSLNHWNPSFLSLSWRSPPRSRKKRRYRCWKIAFFYAFLDLCFRAGFVWLSISLFFCEQCDLRFRVLGPFFVLVFQVSFSFCCFFLDGCLNDEYLVLIENVYFCQSWIQVFFFFGVIFSKHSILASFLESVWNIELFRIQC